MNTQLKWIRKLVMVAACLALLVVMLGAYTRLTHAGLGCPDWPGCYGHMVLPSKGQALQQAQETYPLLPIESRKAWTEMLHRYAAGTLALLIVIIAGFSLRNKKVMPRRLPLFLLGLVIFQAALGMWTVTLKLLPIVVMSHLLGGIIIFSCLCRLRLQIQPIKPLALPTWRKAVIGAVVIVFFQIALGGWVSANYAGIACVGFPQCNGQWWPDLQLLQSFYLFSPVGMNYQGGVLENEARVTIQFIHRCGAAITLVYLLGLSTLLLRKVVFLRIRLLASLIMTLVSTQVLLGIANVVFLLPIGVAVAHNAVAALLMACVLMLQFLVKGRSDVES